MPHLLFDHDRNLDEEGGALPDRRFDPDSPTMHLDNTPGDLPVQLPTKFKFIVNRKAAKALGIDVPLGILLAADEVIE